MIIWLRSANFSRTWRLHRRRHPVRNHPRRHPTPSLRTYGVTARGIRSAAGGRAAARAWRSSRFAVGKNRNAKAVVARTPGGTRLAEPGPGPGASAGIDAIWLRLACRGHGSFGPLVGVLRSWIEAKIIEPFRQSISMAFRRSSEPDAIRSRRHTRMRSKRRRTTTISSGAADAFLARMEARTLSLPLRKSPRLFSPEAVAPKATSARALPSAHRGKRSSLK